MPSTENTASLNQQALYQMSVRNGYIILCVIDNVVSLHYEVT